MSLGPKYLSICPVLKNTNSAFPLIFEGQKIQQQYETTG
jgi:hypothetical protein